jgi:hypothetical protein
VEGEMIEMQPYLVAEEVCRMLEGAISEAQREVFKELAAVAAGELDDPNTQIPLLLAAGELNDPNTQIPLLQQCEKFLREKGIFVYFRVKDDGYPPPEYYFVAGECGVLLDKLEKLSDYLRDLYTFIYNNVDKLPEDIVAELERLYYYIEEFDSLTFFLISSYKYSLEHMKDDFELQCEEARLMIEEVNKYLEQRKDLCRAHAISKL